MLSLYSAVISGDNLYRVDVQTFSPGASASNIAIDISAMDIAPGDMLICYFGFEGDTGTTFNISGFTEIANLFQTDTYDATLRIGYKVMSGPVDSSITLTNGTGNSFDRANVIVESWRAVASYGSAATSVVASTAIANPPALTVDANDIFLVAVLAAHNSGAQSLSSSEFDLTSQHVANISTGDSSLSVGHIIAPGGSFDPAAFTFSTSDSTANSYCACSFSLIR